MLEIDPKDSVQMEAEEIVEVIDGRDKVQYRLTEDSPLVKGEKRPDGAFVRGGHRKGEKHWGHPSIVKRFVDAGWAELTDAEPIVHKMPKPDKR